MRWERVGVDAFHLPPRSGRICAALGATRIDVGHGDASAVLAGLDGGERCVPTREGTTYQGAFA